MGKGGLLPIPQMSFQLSLSQIKLIFLSFLEFPTIFIFFSNELLLQSLSYGGILLSLLLVLGYRTRIVLFLLWILYLSFATGGRDFFYFQWDNLLLETTFLAFFLPSQSISLRFW